jgi:hypothetical protein
MKIKYSKCSHDQRKVIINSVTSRLDRVSKSLNVYTKKKLCDGIYRDFLNLFGQGVDIKPHHVKNIIEGLNKSKDYLVLSSGSPPGYALIYGPNNRNTDIIKAVECIGRDKRRMVKTFDSQVLQPAKKMAYHGLPHALESAVEAEEFIKKISESSALDLLLEEIKQVERTEYETRLFPKTTNHLLIEGI